MEITIREIIIRLSNAYDYTSVRIFFNDENLDFIKENFPGDYNYFAQKEEEYRKLKKSFNNEKDE